MSELRRVRCIGCRAVPPTGDLALKIRRHDGRQHCSPASNSSRWTWCHPSTISLQKAKINFAGKKPRNVYRRLLGMREKSDLAKKQGDDETAYIMLKRWLNSVEWLRRTREDRKSVYSCYEHDRRPGK